MHIISEYAKLARKENVAMMMHTIHVAIVMLMYCNTDMVYARILLHT